MPRHRLFAAAAILVALSALAAGVWAWRSGLLAPAAARQPANGSAAIAAAENQPPEAPAGFRDEAAAAGLDFRMRFLPREQGEIFKINLYDHGCGLAVGDYDGDGHEDLYFLNQLGPNALFRNRGNGTFEDVTARLNVAFDDRICVGATFADYDNDSDQDLYITSTRGGNVLLRNEKGASFTDVTEAAGLRHVGHSQTAAFFDYDKDGWLDLYLVQTAEWTLDELDAEHNYYPGLGNRGLDSVITAPRETNRLYRNTGQGTFVDVTEAAGMRGRGWGGDVAVFDYDRDGWLDVFVTSMFGRAQLYRNQANGSFEDVTLRVLGKTPFGGVGARAFDCNNDGLLDLLVVDMHSDMWMGADFDQTSKREALASEKIRFDSFDGPRVAAAPPDKVQRLEAQLDFDSSEVVYGNAFYKNLGGGKFAEVSTAANLETFWPWSVAAGDFDGDGHEDLFMAAGMGYPFYYWPNYLLMNAGSEVFDNRSHALGIEPPQGGQFLPTAIRGRPAARSSRCAVTADFDGDGRLEIVTNNFNDAPYYFRNHFPRHNYLALKLQGVRSNRDAIGAVVTIPRTGDVLMRQVNAASGYLSHSSKTLHFGLGPAQKVETVEIAWPSGVRQTLRDLAINRLHEIVEPLEQPAEGSAAGPGDAPPPSSEAKQ